MVRTLQIQALDASQGQGLSVVHSLRPARITLLYTSKISSNSEVMKRSFSLGIFFLELLMSYHICAEVKTEVRVAVLVDP